MPFSKKKRSKIKLKPSRKHLLLLLLAIPTIAVVLAVMYVKSLFPTSVSASNPTQVSFTALGDSITSSATITYGWIIKYQSYIQTDIQASSQVTNLGVNNTKSADLLNDLINNQTTRNAVSNADLITLGIGFNDFGSARLKFYNSICGGGDNQDCLRDAVNTFISNWDSIITEIKSLNTKPTTAFRAMDIYLNLPYVVGDFATINPYLTQMNNHINSYSSANGFLVAQVHTAFNGPNGDESPNGKGYIGTDSIHPNDLGHTIMANEFRTLGYTGLDTDGDSIVFYTDNCPTVSNPTQTNSNSETIYLSKPPYNLGFDDITNPVSKKIGDACNPDVDNDKLETTQEQAIGTNPNNFDSDGDGIPDGAEKSCSTNPLNKLSTLMNPLGGSKMPDKDYDSLPDYCETILGTNPNVADSDGDGLTDGAEVNWGANPLVQDSDQDGCRDDLEAANLNNDKRINSTDQLIIAQRFNATRGSANYVRDFDINQDGKINSTDQLLIAQRFNKTCP